MPASSLPSRAIEEFEKGIVCGAVAMQTRQYGHESTTLFVKENSCDSQSKKPRMDRPVLLESSIG